MSVAIRRIEKKDEQAWKELFAGPQGYLVFYKASLPQEVIDTTFLRFFDENEPVYSAVAVNEETDEVFGFINYLTHRSTWSIGDTLYLNDLFVKDDARLKGAGRKLIEFAYSEGDRMKCAGCYWTTQSDNHRAQLLYTKVGVNSGFVKYKRPQ